MSLPKRSKKETPSFQNFLDKANSRADRDDEKYLESVLGFMGIRESKIRFFDIATINSALRDTLGRVPAVWFPKTTNGRKLARGHIQRCPLLWVDQLTFTVREKQLLLALGVVDKVQANGVKAKGLVLPGGGHVETLNERESTIKEALHFGEKLEVGHASVLDAANKELYEEMKIDPKDVLHTQMVAVVNRTRQDFSKQGLSFVYLRAVHGLGGSTSEVKNLVYVKMNDLDNILKEESIKVGGEDVPFTNGHKELIQLITSMPETKAFCAALVDFVQENPVYGQPPKEADEPPAY